MCNCFFCFFFFLLALCRLERDGRVLGHGRVRVLAGPAGGGCGRRRRRRASGPADGGDRGAAPRGTAGEQLTLHRTVAGPGRLIP